jgi:hypothetical protein
MTVNIINAYIILIVVLLSSCIVVPENVENQNAECALSSDKKILKVVNLLDGDATFYAWEDEVFSVITMPGSAIISSVFVTVNNVYHIGEKHIKCN